MEIKKFKASCPVCGRNLFDAQPESHIEGYCPKCKNPYCVSFTATGYTVSIPSSSHSDFVLKQPEQPNMPKR